MLIILAGPVHAAIIVSYFEDGSDLKFEWSGSWDTDGVSDTANYSTKYINSSELADDFYGFTNGYSRIANNITYTQTLGSGIFANNFATKSATGSGDTFAIDWVSQTNVYLYAPVGYVVGQNITGSITIANTTIADVGLAPASFDFGAYGEVHFQALQSVPVPAAIWLFCSGLLGLAGMARRKAA